MASALDTSGAIVFVDTNVLLAADDAHNPSQQARVRDWLQALWQRRAGRVSTQVLNAYYVSTTQHFAMPQGDARAKLRRYQLWQPWQIDHQTVETAWGVEARFGLPYWDALIVAAAAQSGASHVLSLDLQHGQQIDGVTILNPLQATPADLALAD
ncbi:PIN domain-containing protein [Rhodoferax saidenbachensis]|uniref:VapC toxin family PIN domain ribonuclease n=1 Tax=Rhodoferax saidenbachensis TaxID=1484693 RepID=A0A1P8KD52_9BURK|nr:PIN domain-containing protein [Rhodoferax saidenbachensis]APW43924.1 VapC toxin family PIN domain ribonuclease [Rhodoferax saidenbachensis]